MLIANDTFANAPHTDNLNVYNNFFYGPAIGFGDFGTTLSNSNVRLYYNTALGTKFGNHVLEIQSGSHMSGLIVQNNILDGVAVNSDAYTPTTINHNYWGVQPSGAAASWYSAGSDIVGDASVYWTKTPGSVGAGTLTQHYFDLLITSPAINTGFPIAAITTDAYGNFRQSPSEIGGMEYYLPDVIVTALNYDIPTSTFSCVVLNQGYAQTPPGIYVGVAFSVDGVQQTWGAVLGPLASGASITISSAGGGGPYTIPTGTHTISAFVDDVNRFKELNEGNNTFSKSITIP